MYNICVISLVVLTFHTGYSSSRFPGDIILYSLYDHESHRSVRRWVSILYPTIWIWAYNKEGRNVCDWGFNFSKPGWFHGSKVSSETPTVGDNRKGYKKLFIPLKVTATCNILNHKLIYCIFHLACIVVYHCLCSTEHVDEMIFTVDSEYGPSWWPI